MRWFILVVVLVGLLGGPLGAAPANRLTMVCSPTPDWCELVKVEFTRLTGIEVEYQRLGSGEALARLRAERHNPTFDVWFSGTGDPHFVAAFEGITEFYRPKVWKELRPDLTKVTEGRYIPLHTGLHGFGVNDALLTEKNLPAPERWTDLAKPIYRNLIAVPNANTSGTGYLMLTALVQIYGEERAFDLLKQIHRNVASYTRSGGAPSSLIARGEVFIGVSFANDVLSHRVKGFRIRFVAPKDGTPYQIGGLSLVKGAPHSDNASRFIEWALTPEAQALMFKALVFEIPSNVNTPVPIFVPRFEDANVIKYDFIYFGTPEVRDRLLRRWDREVFALPK